MNAAHGAHGAHHMDTKGFAHPPHNVAQLQIEPGMTVADFGAGSGAYALEIGRRLEGSGHVYAIDVQRDLLKRIHNTAERNGLKTVRVIWADVEVPGGTKLAEKSVDLVLVSNLLFQISDKSRVLQEAARIARPHGRVALIDWSDSFGNMGPTKDAVVKKEAAIEIGREAGLQLEKEFAAGAHHYGLIFRTPR